MAVNVFYNPDLVGQLAACGITARRRTPAGAPAAGFVLEGRRIPPRAREAVTNVIAAHGNVTITGQRPPTDRRVPLSLPASTTTSAAPQATSLSEPQTAIELAEECARLRRDNQRLSNEVTWLRSEIDRLTGVAPAKQQRETTDLDDSAKRFALLELE